ncbi:hypothetical protein HB818_14200 [Listeria booriae]|uniref:hypothetical protein n=1 Tax=Listeria booriae TaxID=1552123 RepID=UPI001629B505|nr:hypothetical protein [Listeria booriae]MBC1286911.1 hypothetical protein [Listeria booriae]
MDFEVVLAAILANIIPITAFLISIITFYFASATYFSKRASVKLYQLEQEKASVIIEPDRESDESPDVFHNKKYRVLSEVVLVNKSSLPITVIEFILNNKLKHNSHSRAGKVYAYTGSVQKPLTEHKGVTFGRTQGNETQFFPIEDNFFKPVFNIEPYSSVRGYVFFKYDDKELVNVGNNELTIRTSRKDFNFDLKVDEALYKD